MRDMESHVIGRLALNNDKGFFAEGGFTGYDQYVPDTCSWVDYYQYDIYYNEQVISKDFVVYMSQQGGQAMFFSVIDQLLPFNKMVNYQILRFISAFISALGLACFLLWVKANFGTFVGVINLFLTAGSYWLVLFSANLWWFYGSFFMQFVCLLNYMHKKDLVQKKTWNYIYLITAFTTVLKCFFTGFEYITTFMVMGMMPYFYYLILNSNSLKYSVKKIVLGSLSSLVGALIGMVLLVSQISYYKGGIQEGINHIKYSVLKRTVDTGAEVGEIYLKSIKSSYADVFALYWNKVIIDYPEILHLHRFGIYMPLQFRHFIVFFFILSVIVWFLNREKKVRVIVLTYYISMLAPLSWFIIFKAHTYVHEHMNTIVWFMPTFLFGYIIIGNFLLAIKQWILRKY